MPELPEVEHYCQLLRPLTLSYSEAPVACAHVAVTLPKLVPTPKVFPSESEWRTVIERSCMRHVERKGKIIRIALEPVESRNGPDDNTSLFLYMHMGMTGRISTPNHPTGFTTLKSLENQYTEAQPSYPPAHTHLIITNINTQYQVAFSDTRRFGAISLYNPTHSNPCSLHQQWTEFAPDILQNEPCTTDPYLPLIGNKRGVKALLLDQRCIVSGVGNWIADEVLYESHIHPDQTFLTQHQVHLIQGNLERIVKTAIQCNLQGEEYPSHWIFHQRWSSTKKSVKDFKGRNVAFISSGGRTSAIVPSIQKRTKPRLRHRNEETKRKGS